MSSATEELPTYDDTEADDETKIKIICLGDSAVGKSKLIERFLMDGFQVIKEIPSLHSPICAIAFHRHVR